MTRGFAAAVRARVHNLRYGFLFAPGAVAAGVSLLAPLLVAFDRAGGADGLGVGFQAEPDAARTVLATIAGSLITVAGLTFSITIVSLQLVSQQFSPRALRGFLGDRLTQIVVGAFVGTFVYCVLVLRTVTEGAERDEAFVPALSVSAAVALAVIAIALLLVFIHHMARTIQVSTIAAGIADATLSSLEPLYADTFGEPAPGDPDELARLWHGEGDPDRITARRAGYVQSVAFERLDAIASGRVLRARLRVVPGDFVTPGTVLVEYWSDDPGAVESALGRAVTVENERDLQQDADFGLRQLADIALKAISPGVNDPTTAVTCIGYLRAILERLARLQTPVAVRRYGDRDVTLLATARPFREYVETAFLELGRYAESDMRVAGAILAAAASVAQAVVPSEGEDRLADVAAVSADVADRARAHASTSHDRDALADLVRAVEAATARGRS